ncbi:MAG: aspartate aminotransferase family protein [Bacteroidales bacterium]|nr:aspartate aminotransferase family protein [Bacteroidales bacterium]
MISQRQLFLQHVGQTSPSPLLLEIMGAEGIYLLGAGGEKYIDLIAGVSVSNLGHAHPAIIKAVKDQVDKYMHLMVYGEYVQAPQVEFAQLLTDQLPDLLESVYFVNSGSEANEGAIKLAKRFTGRSEVVAFKKAYHGSTQALLSLMSDKNYTRAFRPLMPNVRLLDFNNEEDLNQITEKTACVIAEPIQGEAGIVLPENNFLNKLRKRCNETGSLLIFDEIQTGFGRTGALFAFQKYQVWPDILSIAKAMGGGMPIGGFVASKEIMDSLTNNPVLGHITTFGGHPVSAAAGLANLKVLLENDIISEVEKKGLHLIKQLNHREIIGIYGTGLIYSVALDNSEKLFSFISRAIKNGLVSDWFLYNDSRFRISPPLNITYDELDEVAKIILKTLNEL